MKVAAYQFFYRYPLPQASEKFRYVAARDRSVLETEASWVADLWQAWIQSAMCLDPIADQIW